ncbi:hexitol phosphatase HxpB [Limnobaculum zhutongyuii]|uniref:Hexitol phosphatase HxpB n=1 Tax=Limnobaculum zhutongyuii TaxID=2498113 RepID=A0A411WK78_9GAMM|nr:hexitol phosphatase HxpB [Limnobaculum zhutongyuii]QBH96560.1 hexitol phosphatase HxpB [Limnobaculum zhutongyuii]TQS90409.1 hexitol phosphatase HxpB [Limnobaculum zhutongyuii]
MTTAIIFDMDGVLVDSEPVWVKVEQEIYLQCYGVHLDDEDFKDSAGIRIDKLLTEHHHRHSLPLEDVPRRVEEIVTEVGRRIQTHPQPMPGVVELLETIQQHGLPIVVASSSPRKQIARVLDALNISHYFSHQISAEGMINGKPHPAVFLRASEILNVNPEECIVIEDAVNGMVAAKAAQMKVIVMPAPEACQDKRFGLADVQVNSLGEVWQAIQQLK